jgi:nitrite reductase/ring-hydroxylating ferredoxin subunit
VRSYERTYPERKDSGHARKNIVACPPPGSTYDIATGKNLSGPVEPPPTDMSAVPEPVLEQLAHAAELSALIKVHDLKSIEVERGTISCCV